MNGIDPYALITSACERWPLQPASGVCLPRVIRVGILHHLCDVYSGGVITHRARRELKRTMRSVNKRQQSTHLPSSMVSFDRCVYCCAWERYVCSELAPDATKEGDGDQSGVAIHLFPTRLTLSKVVSDTHQTSGCGGWRHGPQVCLWTDVCESLCLLNVLTVEPLAPCLTLHALIPPLQSLSATLSSSSSSLSDPRSPPAGWLHC